MRVGCHYVMCCHIISLIFTSEGDKEISVIKTEYIAAKTVNSEGKLDDCNRL